MFKDRPDEPDKVDAGKGIEFSKRGHVCQGLG
jgi:hypothetical protein